jgi:hypothetical protein
MAKLSTGEEVAAAEALAQAAGAESAGGGGSTFRSNVCLFQPSLKLTDLAVTTETGGTATVTWKTDSDALTAVQFGIESDSDLKEFELEDFVKDHVTTLEGLVAGKSYRLKATSVDKCGNVTTSDEYSFTVPGAEDLPPEEHAAAPEEPAASSSSSSSSSSLSPEEAKQQALDVLKTLSATMTIVDFKQTLLAQVENISNEALGLPGPVLQGEPKVTVTDRTATVSWSTNEPSTSLVKFSSSNTFEAGTYTTTSGNPEELVIRHEVMLVDLNPGTLYHYQIRSTTPIGTESNSTDYTFETPSIHAKVDNYSSSVLSPQSAVFRWQTNVESSTRITLLPYREGEPQSSEAITFTNTSFTTTHDLTADSLEPGTVYEVEIAGRTAGGTDVSQIIPRFATTEDSLSPALSRVKADVAISPGKDASTQVIITWETDKRATSRIRYQQGVATDPKVPMTSTSPLSTSFGRTHTVILSGLTPGTVFSFQAESVDYEGRTGLSKIFTILTPRKQESIFQVITKEFEGAFGWMSAFRGQ